MNTYFDLVEQTQELRQCPVCGETRFLVVVHRPNGTDALYTRCCDARIRVEARV